MKIDMKAASPMELAWYYGVLTGYPNAHKELSFERLKRERAKLMLSGSPIETWPKALREEDDDIWECQIRERLGLQVSEHTRIMARCKLKRRAESS